MKTLSIHLKLCLLTLLYCVSIPAYGNNCSPTGTIDLQVNQNGIYDCKYPTLILDASLSHTIVAYGCNLDCPNPQRTYNYYLKFYVDVSFESDFFTEIDYRIMARNDVEVNMLYKYGKWTRLEFVESFCQRVHTGVTQAIADFSEIHNNPLYCSSDLVSLNIMTQNISTKISRVHRASGLEDVFNLRDGSVNSSGFGNCVNFSPCPRWLPPGSPYNLNGSNRSRFIPTDESIASSKVYPNPAVSSITIEIQDKKGTYQISDVQGKIVKTGNKTESGPQTISVGDLHPGVYFIQIRSASGLSTHKVQILR